MYLKRNSRSLRKCTLSLHLSWKYPYASVHFCRLSISDGERCTPGVHLLGESKIIIVSEVFNICKTGLTIIVYFYKIKIPLFFFAITNLFTKPISVLSVSSIAVSFTAMSNNHLADIPPSLGLLNRGILLFSHLLLNL